MRLRTGLLVIAIIILLFFPAWAMQAGARMLIALLAVSWILSRLPRNSLGIHVEQPVMRAFLNEKTVIRIRISNNGLVPFSHLAVKDHTGSLSVEGASHKVMALPGRSQAILEYRVRSQHRGLHHIGPILFRSGDPMGLFPWTSQASMERMIFIYPQIQEMDLHAFRGMTGGPISSRHPMYLDNTRIRSVRDYQSGDDPRRIHWKASASQGHLLTVEHERTLTIPFYVILNLHKDDYSVKRRSSHVERCIEAAAAFIHLSSFRNYDVGFICNGLIPPETRPHLGLGSDNDLPFYHEAPGPGHQMASRILSLLSVIRENPLPSPWESCLSGLRTNLHPRVLVITPPLREPDFHAIIAMVPSGCRMDYWFLEEHQSREGRIDHRAVPPGPMIHMNRLPEYGEGLTEAGNGR